MENSYGAARLRATGAAEGGVTTVGCIQNAYHQRLVFLTKWSVINDRYLCSQRCADYASIEETLDESMLEDDDLDALLRHEEEDLDDLTCEDNEWDALFWNAVDMDALTEHWMDEDREMNVDSSNEVDAYSSDDEGLPSFDLGIL